jgi:hypothetical protein
MTADQNQTSLTSNPKTLLVAASILAVLLILSALYGLIVSGELKETAATLAAREGSLKMLEADLATTQARLHDAQQQLSKKPDVPIRLGLRPSTLGKGKVVLFKNMLAQPLSVAATFKNTNLNLEKSFRLDFGPDQEKQIGHLEGWQFESGDEITLVNQRFETKHVRVP